MCHQSIGVCLRASRQKVEYRETLALVSHHTSSYIQGIHRLLWSLQVLKKYGNILLTLSTLLPYIDRNQKPILGLRPVEANNRIIALTRSSDTSSIFPISSVVYPLKFTHPDLTPFTITALFCRVI